MGSRCLWAACKLRMRAAQFGVCGRRAAQPAEVRRRKAAAAPPLLCAPMPPVQASARMPSATTPAARWYGAPSIARPAGAFPFQPLLQHVRVWALAMHVLLLLCAGTTMALESLCGAEAAAGGRLEQPGRQPASSARQLRLTCPHRRLPHRRRVHVEPYNAPPSLAAPQEQQQPLGVCRDNHESCAYWAGNGECSKNPVYMKGDQNVRGNCRLSCKVRTGVAWGGVPAGARGAGRLPGTQPATVPSRFLPRQKMIAAGAVGRKPG